MYLIKRTGSEIDAICACDVTTLEQTALPQRVSRPAVGHDGGCGQPHKRAYAAHDPEVPPYQRLVDCHVVLISLKLKG